MVAAALDELVGDVQQAADEHDVTFLGTDIDHDGGKIILVAGVPPAIGRRRGAHAGGAARIVQAAELRLPSASASTRGPIFAGDVGPPYRRTYTVMGDTVNLAARLMAQAEPGQILATQRVLDACAVDVRDDRLEPFM